MAHLTVDIGGRPGIDCRGFCEYCYFKHVRDTPPFGCRYCPPFRKGCDYCSRSVREYYSGFRDLRDVADDVLARLQAIPDEVSRITISGGGDPSCYPRFRDLIELLASMEAPLHIGYTSGKGFDDPGIADFLVESGLSEISFTVFSVRPGLRKRYMHDPTPEASLAVLERLCGEIDVYAACVVLPGVNDGPVLEETCQWLEERGAKGTILMRFANRTDQGLILGNAPVIQGQKVQEVAEFRDMVTALSRKFRMKVSGTPLWDPRIGSPFALAAEPDLVVKLPRIGRRASVISGRIAAPFIASILSRCGEGASVVPVEKDIACLITIDDLRALDPRDLGTLVIIPGRAFVYDREAQSVLSRDGVERTVLRGPECLTADAETSMGMDRNAVLALEMEAFADLIRLINRYGQPL
ncbi:MAG: methyl coenzyme M reductase-arginine methyltransferase Mmp10 [Methanolinea sp.]|nr:methyl coenzyme M reductase-arginine methyltransferase Mmp10 [Methanolinea sp.]